MRRASAGLGPTDRLALAAVWGAHTLTPGRRTAGPDDSVKRARSVLRVLRKRARLRAGGEGATELVVEAPGAPAEGLADWLATDVARERLRPITRCNRILSGIGRWPLAWLKAPAVVAYERAHGRVVRERPRCGGRSEIARRDIVRHDRILDSHLSKS